MAHSSRYFPNTFSNLPLDVHENFLASLTKILTRTPPKPSSFPSPRSFPGLYSGPTSIAYLFLRLSHLYPKLLLQEKTLSSWGESYLALSADIRWGVDASHCGIANEGLARLVVTAGWSGESRKESVVRLCAGEVVEVVCGKGGSDEWLYGRAGYLYLLRAAKRGYGDADEDVKALIQDVEERVIDRILQSPQPWIWHGTAYLGAAHGTIGILTQIILSSPSRAPTLTEALLTLLSTQFSSGNFPSSLPPTSDKLVQFCHGAPGFIISLTALRSHFHPNTEISQRVDNAIRKGGVCVWERGILKKWPSLCHGVAGNAMAMEGKEWEMFLGALNKGGVEGWWGEEEKGNEGLFTGEAGRAWVWGVAGSSGPRELGCIGYSDLR
ncbi:MAG: hypothetical protein M1839_002283 [Geoglossum umbratile]|nr:MAG: hypothetical protein M1839_002283 [Geoglossum umbratile]